MSANGSLIAEATAATGATGVAGAAGAARRLPSRVTELAIARPPSWDYRPGDFVWVPEKPDVTAWQLAREVLTSLAQVGTVIIAIRSLR